MKTSDRYFLDAFHRNFETLRHRGAPVAIYGIGDKTRILLEHNAGFNFVGLMDRDSAGSVVYGLPVFHDHEVAARAECIIIVANMSVAPLIRKRIEHLSPLHGLKIFYVNGRDASGPQLRPRETGHQDPEGLKREIDQCDVVSFDLFDTLVMRKVLRPTDIFDIVARELSEQDQIRIDFKAQRIEAERQCYRQIDRYCTIRDIYRRLQEMVPYDNGLAQKILDTEIATEIDFCTPRDSMVACLRHAVRRGKVVLVTTDTFLTRDIVLRVLAKCGITGFDRLLISCEERRLKHLGDMWGHVRQLYPGRTILHIGDNPISDVDMAVRETIKAFKIESAYEVISTSSLRRLCEAAKTVDDNRLLGQIAATVLNNPFATGSRPGPLNIDDPFTLGYCCFGPMVLSYLLWLVREADECGVGTLLFFARDGYVLNRLYRKLRDRCRLACPEPVYFLTSRRAASVAAIETERDIEFILEHLCKSQKAALQGVLPMAFNVHADSDDRLALKKCHEVDPEALVRHIVTRYGERILGNARTERHAYGKYLRTLGLRDRDRLGCVNFVGRGITQRMVSRILKRDLEGFYFAKEVESLDVYPTGGEVHSLYEGYISPHVSQSYLAANYLYGEIVFSSPEAQLIRFDSTARPVFDPTEPRRNFDAIAECHRGIERLIDDMMDLDPRLPRRRFDTDLVDRLYGLFTESDCVVSEDVKAMFRFTDYYSPHLNDVQLTPT